MKLWPFETVDAPSAEHACHDDPLGVVAFGSCGRYTVLRWTLLPYIALAQVAGVAIVRLLRWL